MSSTLAQFLHRDRFGTAAIVMNVQQVRHSVDELVSLLFPQRGCIKMPSLSDTEATVGRLRTQFEEYFKSVSVLALDFEPKISSITEEFFNQLPEIARTLDLDAMASFSGDPAAYSREEVIITYPGFYAVCIYRLAHAISRLGAPLIPRLMSEYAHEKTGIDIHPGASIGESFFIDHGTGVVIGETAIIGKNVKIYQGVTLGALSVKKRLQSIKRHPTIDDDVVIYANSTILGGETVIGRGSIIGGNTWITQSMPAGSVVFNKLEISHSQLGK
ncbi:MAG TPA: serine O-acetyltransferase [Bacteriovoracaceae bacterium]|nr:serine O-acetyltransferase [Bacteriovoracaceae bacterium]